MMIRSALPLALVAMFAAPLSAQCHCQGGPGMGSPREGRHGMMLHPGGPGMGHGPEAGPMMMRGLDLTEAQKSSLKALADKHREAMKGKREAAMEAMKALHEAMADPATPVEKLKALHEKASQAQFEGALARRAMMQESMALLTPEQKAKAEKLRAERPKEGRRGMHRRGEGARHGVPPQGPAPEKK